MSTYEELCIYCGKPVGERQEGLECDGCHKWQHRKCDTVMPRHIYWNLVKSGKMFRWKCRHCSGEYVLTSKSSLQRKNKFSVVTKQTTDDYVMKGGHGEDIKPVIIAHGVVAVPIKQEPLPSRSDLAVGSFKRKELLTWTGKREQTIKVEPGRDTKPTISHAVVTSSTNAHIPGLSDITVPKNSELKHAWFSKRPSVCLRRCDEGRSGSDLRYKVKLVKSEDERNQHPRCPYKLTVLNSRTASRVSDSHITTHAARKKSTKISNRTRRGRKRRKVSKVNDHLKTMKLVVDPSGRFVCAHCNADFGNKGTLAAHIRNHFGPWRFICVFCGKCFNNKRDFIEHERIHTGEKPHACSECQSRFREKSALTKHMRIHTGVKPFHCTICDTRFRQMAHLRSHMKTHSGHKPHACDICQLKFPEKGHLRRHQRNAHAREKPITANW